MLDDVGFNKFVNEHAKQIDGWFFPADMVSIYLLALIQKSMAITGSLCEVGVHHGKSLVLLSLIRQQGEKLTGYDLFVGGRWLARSRT